MKTTYIRLIICILILGSNQVIVAQITPQCKDILGSMPEGGDLLQYSLPGIMGKDKDYVTANIEKLRPLTNMMPLPKVVSEKDTKFSSVPMFVFGFAGAFAGAWIGHTIADDPPMPGEPAELFTKGALIGAGVGLISGVILGYFLGKEKPKKDRQKKYLRLEAY